MGYEDRAALARIEALQRELGDLRASAERLTAAFESAPDALMVVDGNGRIVQVNAQGPALFGWTHEELVGRAVEDLMPERFRRRHVHQRSSYVREPVNRPMGVGLDLRGLRKDGTEFPLEISLSPVRSAEGVMVVAAIRDMTERRRVEDRLRAEEAARRSEERFRLLLENASDGILVLDADRRVTYVSPAIERIVGLEAAVLQPRPVMDHVHPEDVDRARRYGDECFRTPGMGPVVELRVRHVEGTWRVVEVVGNNLLGHPGVGAVVMTVRDVTERKRLESQLLQTQKMESVGRLAGGVAHDFNNLLTGILSYTELAQEQAPEGSPVREHLEVVARAAQQAAALTRQLLVFSRRHPAQSRIVDMNDMVRDVERLLSRLIGENIELDVRPALDLGRVRVDPSLVEQVILNLAVNSRDAMPEGGRLTLESANVFLDQPYCRRYPGMTPGEYVMVAVSDTGVGMDDEVKAHLFEPFFTTKEQGRGTGLGLATSYAVVKGAGGHIAVYSEKGHGTTVKVYFPRVAENGTRTAKAVEEGETPRGSETLLVVEDDRALRDLVVRVLTSLGYQVLPAENGERALEIAAEHPGPIHLVVTDVVMPGFGGLVLADRLKPLRPDTRVLFMSGYAANAPALTGAASKGMPLLNKPFTPKGLGRKVREILDDPL